MDSFRIKDAKFCFKYDFQKSELSKNILLKAGKIVYFFIEIRNEYLNNNKKKR